jgi:hypothetical protein
VSLHRLTFIPKKEDCGNRIVVRTVASCMMSLSDLPSQTSKISDTRGWCLKRRESRFFPCQDIDKILRVHIPFFVRRHCHYFTINMDCKVCELETTLVFVSWWRVASKKPVLCSRRPLELQNAVASHNPVITKAFSFMQGRLSMGSQLFGC